MRLLMRIAWRNIWRQKRRTWITAGAMALGVAFCMATIALSDGMFADVFRILVRQNMGHVQIHNPVYPKQRALHETIPHGTEVLSQVEALPGLARASGRLYGYALLGVGEKAAGAQLGGVDPEREAPITGIAEKMESGRYLSETPSREIVLGAGLAESLEAEVGDEVVAVTQAADGSMGNDLYTIVGTFRTGSVVFDRGGAFLHREDLGTLLVLPDEIHEIVGDLAQIRGALAGPLPALLAAPVHGGERRILVPIFVPISPGRGRSRQGSRQRLGCGRRPR